MIIPLTLAQLRQPTIRFSDPILNINTERLFTLPGEGKLVVAGVFEAEDNDAGSFSGKGHAIGEPFREFDLAKLHCEAK